MISKVSITFFVVMYFVENELGPVPVVVDFPYRHIIAGSTEATPYN